MQAILAFKPDQEWGSFLLENPFQLLTNFGRRQWDELSQFAFGRRCTVGHIQQNCLYTCNSIQMGIWTPNIKKRETFEISTISSLDFKNIQKLENLSHFWTVGTFFVCHLAFWLFKYWSWIRMVNWPGLLFYVACITW